jgi:2-dehydropantoate 2-reductase
MKEVPAVRIAMIGAGGVGGVMAADLVRAGAVVRLLARGAHLAAIQSRGLRVETAEAEATVLVDATESLEGNEAFDLAIIAVKSWSLDDVAPVAASLAKAGAIVVPLLNGVDAADRLAERGVPRRQLLGGLVYVSATRVGHGHVRRTSPFRRAIVGELDGGMSPRADHVAAILGHAGWEASAVPDINVHLWRKYIFITSFASACALSRTSIGRIRAAPLGPFLLDHAVDEILAVARAHGIALPDGERERVRAQLDAMPADMKPSLLHDLEHGGPTEVDALSGAIARLGRTVSVPTPIHDAATAAIQAALSAASDETQP